MKQVTRNECDFDELFYFAEKHFNIGWNDCTRLFFDDQYIPYKGYRDFDLEELESDLLYDKDGGYFYLTETSKRVYEVIVDFMKSHKVTELRIYGSS